MLTDNFYIILSSLHRYAKFYALCVFIKPLVIYNIVREEENIWIKLKSAISYPKQEKRRI